MYPSALSAPLEGSGSPLAPLAAVLPLHLSVVPDPPGSALWGSESPFFEVAAPCGCPVLVLHVPRTEAVHGDRAGSARCELL